MRWCQIWDRILILFLFLNFVSTPRHRVVLFRVGACSVEYFFEPLQELKIILVLALDQFFHIDMLHDVEFGEALLQYFEIIQVFVVKFGLPIDLSEGDFARVDEIE